MEPEALSAVLTKCWEQFKAEYESGPHLAKSVGGGTPSCIHWSEADIQHRLASLLEGMLEDSPDLAVHLELNLRVSTVDLAIVSAGKFNKPLQDGANSDFIRLVKATGGVELAAEIAVLLDNNANSTYGRPKIEDNLFRLHKIRQEGLASLVCLFMLDKTGLPQVNDWVESLRREYADVLLLSVHDSMIK